MCANKYSKRRGLLPRPKVCKVPPQIPAPAWWPPERFPAIFMATHPNGGNPIRFARQFTAHRIQGTWEWRQTLNPPEQGTLVWILQPYPPYQVSIQVYGYWGNWYWDVGDFNWPITWGVSTLYIVNQWDYVDPYDPPITATLRCRF